jgi:delta-aminolevulinic acid dehydratase/porphobilinogen synthase
MDPYNSDGHDGVVKNGEILNDETLEILGKMAITQAKARCRHYCAKRYDGWKGRLFKKGS